jgi:septal ring factor EnvC (AmiA/AmiB activator)
MKNWAFSIAICLFSICVNAQNSKSKSTTTTTTTNSTKKNLENKYTSLLNDIKLLEKSLAKTTTQKNESMQQLQAVSKKVEMRIALINNINQQVVALDKDILEKNTSISLMSSDLNKLKSSYANTLKFVYKNMPNESMLSYILNANSVKDAYNRYLLFKKYTEYNEKQSQKIMSTIENLHERSKSKIRN